MVTNSLTPMIRDRARCDECAPAPGTDRVQAATLRLAEAARLAGTVANVAGSGHLAMGLAAASMVLRAAAGIRGWWTARRAAAAVEAGPAAQ